VPGRPTCDQDWSAGERRDQGRVTRGGRGRDRRPNDGLKRSRAGSDADERRVHGRADQAVRPARIVELPAGRVMATRSVYTSSRSALVQRSVLVILTLILALSGGVAIYQSASAQGRPGDTILVDEIFRLAPGADLRQCLVLPEMVRVTILVVSPIGRTGETASFLFRDDRETVDPNVQLSTVEIPTEDIVSAHLAPAGSYCYYITVTHRLTSILPAGALEMPDKQVHLKIISTPYTR
jgi:hypothetical protein